MTLIKDYKILSYLGNIGFYNSCEVTQLFLHRKKDKRNINFFILAVFEEKPFKEHNHNFLCKPITINKDFSLGIQRYSISPVEAELNFIGLLNENKWIFNGDNSLEFPILKKIPKQFVSSEEGNRINYILKNNFHCGSYILEFFDEEKNNFDFILNLDLIKRLNDLSGKIKKFVPIDFSLVRDRIGNIIFQFPINIFEVKSNPTFNWDGVKIFFTWHHLIKHPPSCLLHVESVLDKNCMGGKIEKYNKRKEQIINIGNLDQMTAIRIWREKPNLILYSSNGVFIKDINLTPYIGSHEPRVFEIDGKMYEEQISSLSYKSKPAKVDYKTYVANTVYEAEKSQLEKTLSFKQYRNIKYGLSDLIKLIQTNDENGIYLWDPFLTSYDILKTLYFSRKGGVPLKAIGSINDTVRQVYNLKKLSFKNIISDYKNVLDNPKNNNLGLNLEFRLQYQNYGWPFHDRFLIFPGGKSKRPKVYSLGTSINSYGKNHHILQEVSHPQPVIDSFNELWNELKKPDCVVWKYPK